MISPLLTDPGLPSWAAVSELPAILEINERDSAVAQQSAFTGLRVYILKLIAKKIDRFFLSS